MSQNSSTKKVMRSRSRSQSRSPQRLEKVKTPKTESQLKKQLKKDTFNKEIDELYKQRRELKKLNETFTDF